VEHYVLDTFPLPVCENVRAPRRRLAPGLTYRGYIPSKRAYFHGLKLHLVCNNHPFITEVLCTPVQGLYLLPLDLAQGSALYVDRGTWQRTTWRWPGASRKGNSRRYHQPNQFIATLGRRIIESVGSALTELFPLWDSCHHPPGLCAQGLGLHLCPQLQAAGQRFVGSNLGGVNGPAYARQTGSPLYHAQYHPGFAFLRSRAPLPHPLARSGNGCGGPECGLSFSLARGFAA